MKTDKRSPKEKLFRSFKAGNEHALAEMLEMERAQLYDYLVRMTGQVNRSTTTIDEVFMSFQSSSAKMIMSASEFRVALYRTARNFNLDIWHADTSKLVNLALDSEEDSRSKSSADIQELERFRTLDKSLRHVRGQQREAIILRIRYGFTFEDIGEITTTSGDSAEAKFDSGMQIIDADCSGVVERPEEALLSMPGHPVPMQTIQDTMSLSIIMEDIKTPPAGLRSPLRIALILLMVSAFVIYFFFPQYIPKHVMFWR